MSTQKLKILFCASEALPFIKTGGLADVAGSLPDALQALGHDVAVLLPAYRSVFDGIDKYKKIGEFSVYGFGKAYQVNLLKVEDKALNIKAFLIDIPGLFNRAGGPYLAPDGKDWWDNGERFSIFSKAVVEMAMDRVGMKWKADVVHSNDWQTGLVPALLTLEADRPRTLFTIHNMAYQGNFPYSVFLSLVLPGYWWHRDGIEFHGGMSMLKAGIMMSDKVTTVSPTYANEICTKELAYGFEGVMKKCRDEGRLKGILNGIDTTIWNPEIDTYIAANYTDKIRPTTSKAKNKEVLLTKLGANIKVAKSKRPLLGFVGRLVAQKGIDLILEVLPDLIAHSQANFVFVGSGDGYLEGALRYFAHQYPDRVFVYVGYSEELAHLVEAGADLFMMPSRFEPCGLNQIYSLAYGTPPIVNHTGGLADTVVNASKENIKLNRGTGFVFYEPTAFAVKETIYYALGVYNQKTIWNEVRNVAMRQNFSWEKSAIAYNDLYLN